MYSCTVCMHCTWNGGRHFWSTMRKNPRDAFEKIFWIGKDNPLTFVIIPFGEAFWCACACIPCEFFCRNQEHFHLNANETIVRWREWWRCALRRVLWPTWCHCSASLKLVSPNADDDLQRIINTNHDKYCTMGLWCFRPRIEIASDTTNNGYRRCVYDACCT